MSTTLLEIIDRYILNYCIKRDRRSGIKRLPTDYGYYKNPNKEDSDALWFWND